MNWFLAKLLQVLYSMLVVLSCNYLMQVCLGTKREFKRNICFSFPAFSATEDSVLKL